MKSSRFHSPSPSLVTLKRGSARLMKEFLKRSGVSDYHGVCLTWRSLEKFVRSEIAHLGKLTPEDVDSCCPKIRWYCWCAKMVCLETDGGSSKWRDPHVHVHVVEKDVLLMWWSFNLGGSDPHRSLLWKDFLDIQRLLGFACKQQHVTVPKTNILLMEEDPAPRGISKILVNTGINYLSTGAGFLPSTISPENGWDPLEEAILSFLLRWYLFWGSELCLFHEG